MPRFLNRPGLLVTACVIAVCVAPGHAETIGWRTDGTGNYPDANPPLEWSKTQNVKWFTPTDQWSNASPVIVGSRIFVCAEPTTLVCIDANSGKILWQQGNDYGDLKPRMNTDLPRAHGTNGYSSATPVTDGRNVYVKFGTGVVASYDLRGKRRWITFVEKPKAGWGSSASPALVGNRLAVLYTRLFGLDTRDGSVKWNTPSSARWGSLVPVQVGNESLVATPSGQLVRPRDGAALARGLGDLKYNAPIVQGDTIYYIDGERRVVASTLEATEGGVTATAKWDVKIHGDRYYSSPVIHDGLIYAINQRSMFSVIDANTGDVVYKQKLALGGGTTYPSITCAGEHVFVSSDNGTTIVLEPGREYKEVAKNRLDGFRSSPVFIGDKLFVRTNRGLYCITGSTRTAAAD